MHNYQRDWFMRFGDNGGGGRNYWPNSFAGPDPELDAAEPPVELYGKADRYVYPLVDDDFVQPGDLYRKVTTDQGRANLVNNIVGHLKGVQGRIQLRQTALFYKADHDYGSRVAEGLELDLKKKRTVGRYVPRKTGLNSSIEQTLRDL